jgi:sugar/nucleoside kinase (ribokinase family)
MPRSFAEALTGPASLPELARAAAARCGQAWLVVVTDGKNGSAAFVDGRLVETPAFPVATLDSCGAGDVHGGALAAALLDGLAPGDALRFAAGAAALKCPILGNTAAPANRDAVCRLIGENPAPADPC